ncbi:MAG TPA: cytidylate kinase, partial [bacterium (Candidatus Stahlbacteria)]|nr:cytidylate kinase [Candidatus Stahlbacteria bacterium]
RRQRQLEDLGIKADIKEITENIKFRDRYDSSRPVAPLTRSHDAIVVDNTNLSIEKEIEVIAREVMDRLAE